MSEQTSLLSISELSIQNRKATGTDNYMVVLASSGNLTAVIDGRILNIPENHIIILSPDIISCIKGDDDCAIFFSFKGKGEILDKIKDKIYPLTEDKTAFIKECTNDKSDLYLFKLKLALQLILSYCYDLKSVNALSDKKDAATFTKAVSILKENIGGEISVDELADNLKISLSQVKRLFAKYSDIGVHEYLIALKIIKAKDLLRQNISVTETSERVGFATQAYFSAAFKKITGVSPKAYMQTDYEKPLTKPKDKQIKKTKENSRDNLPSYLL